MMPFLSILKGVFLSLHSQFWKNWLRGSQFGWKESNWKNLQNLNSNLKCILNLILFCYYIFKMEIFWKISLIETVPRWCPFTEVRRPFNGLLTNEPIRQVVQLTKIPHLVAWCIKLICFYNVTWLLKWWHKNKLHKNFWNISVFLSFLFFTTIVRDYGCNFALACHRVEKGAFRTVEWYSHPLSLWRVDWQLSTGRLIFSSAY